MNMLPHIPPSKLLPEDARGALFAASQCGSHQNERGDDLARNIAVELAVQYARRKYPQHFKMEPQT